MLKLGLVAVALMALSTSAFSAIRFSGCSSSAKQTVTQIHRNMEKAMSDYLDAQTGIPHYNLNTILTDFVEPEGRTPNSRYRNHNSTYTQFQSRTLSNLRKMQSKMNSGYTYKCVSSSNSRCRGGEVWAYVLFSFGRPSNIIHFCPTFFRETTRQMEKINFHELSHLAANTDHGENDPTIFSDRGVIAQTGDAYFYQNMMGTVDIAQYLRFRSWGHMWTDWNKHLSEIPLKPDHRCGTFL